MLQHGYLTCPRKHVKGTIIVTIHVQETVPVTTVSCVAITNCSRRIGSMDRRPNGWEGRRTTISGKNMDALSVLNKLGEYLARLILVIFSAVNLLGVFWFQNAAYPIDLAIASTIGISALIIGVLPTRVCRINFQAALYITLCLVGITAVIAESCLFYIGEGHLNGNLVEQFLLLAAYLYMASLIFRRARKAL